MCRFELLEREDSLLACVIVGSTFLIVWSINRENNRPLWKTASKKSFYHMSSCVGCPLLGHHGNHFALSLASSVVLERIQIPSIYCTSFTCIRSYVNEICILHDLLFLVSTYIYFMSVHFFFFSFEKFLLTWIEGLRTEDAALLCRLYSPLRNHSCDFGL